jgi:nicotinamidase-related amidase
MRLTDGSTLLSEGLVDPATTALISMEMQRGVVGDLSKIDVLTKAVKDDDLIAHSAVLMKAARKAGITVIHCNAQFRADRRGSSANCPMLVAVTKDPTHILEGTPPTEIVPELGPEKGDLVFPRYHGVSPFTGTNLDITLRNLGVKTIVATGVSINLGIFGTCVEAVNLGYRVVLPRDCISGFPKDYAEQVLRYSLSQLCTITTTAELMGAWEKP